MKGTRVRGAVVLVAVITAAGCGLVDYKYEVAEVQDVVKGIVPSPSDRYRIPMPEIPIVRKNIGIVRESSLFIPIVGPDLKSTLEKYSGEEVEFGVHFLREPRRHLVLERVWTRDEEIQLLAKEEKFRYRLPQLVDASDIAFQKFDQEVGLCEVPPQDGTKLASAEHQRVFVSEFHVRKSVVPDQLVGTELVVASQRPTDRAVYFITSRGSDYLVTNNDPMTCLMLDYLLAEDREFKGGILVEGIFERRARVDTRVAGTVDIKWIALGGPLYFRSS
jgi:hypothetical protein